MFSATSRQVSLALFLCAIAVGIAPASLEAEESTLYTLGKYTAFARHCGHHDLVNELQSRYGSLEEFKTGRHKNDLQKYDRVRLPCGKLENVLENFLVEVRSKEAK
ncbi:hypothetical protein [Pelagibius sp. Alg239-R121]|uniref:hypothetical protein n=1 Tax=Pelagibius sp. Alg239-R121 TaxID=2993448 RepID=UPI0024A7552B|nr:hypothetical protein [Pelagibius sp. Alg239-R121]